MAFDDPVIWVLIIAVIVLIFGASRIPKLARALGEARSEFQTASKGTSSEMIDMTTKSKQIIFPSEGDPLVVAAQKGRNRHQRQNQGTARFRTFMEIES